VYNTDFKVTKYDASSADLNPMRSISKQGLKWVQAEFNLAILRDWKRMEMLMEEKKRLAREIEGIQGGRW
jgi:hypothetical protein